jgi:hypothetical protein
MPRPCSQASHCSFFSRRLFSTSKWFLRPWKWMRDRRCELLLLLLDRREWLPVQDAGPPNRTRLLILLACDAIARGHQTCLDLCSKSQWTSFVYDYEAWRLLWLMDCQTVALEWVVNKILLNYSTLIFSCCLSRLILQHWIYSITTCIHHVPAMIND